MLFDPPLTPARLLRRYKRFLADVEFADGERAVAHVPNSGAMLGVSEPGARVWLSPSRARLPWRLRLVETPLGLAGVDTHLPNALTAEALERGAIAEACGYATIRREVRFGEGCRVDFLLEDPARKRCYLEVKNVHLMREPGLAEFPDCTAARSARHMRALAAEVDAGHRAIVLFVVQRAGAAAFRPAGDLDPSFARALAAAVDRGVEAIAYGCGLCPDGVVLDQRLPLTL